MKYQADIIDAPSDSVIAWSNALLSIPTARMHSSDLSAGPVLSTHFYDIQSSPKYISTPPTESGGGSHTGAPVVNVEVVLKGVEEALESEKGKQGEGSSEPIKGRLWARGPAFGLICGESGGVGSDG
jgi:long-chain acyl-CoA synthetase